LDAVRAREQFQDTHVALALMQSGRREWLRLTGRGVHHYYVQGLWGFVKKRRRAIAHYMNVRDESAASWLKVKPPVPIWLGALYCVTLLGPLWHALRGWRRDADLRWWWHCLACPASVLGTVWGVWTQRTSRNRDRLVSDLQVDQSLRRNPPRSGS
jgi:hypothetical protein